MVDGDLVLGPVTGTYYSLFQTEISNIHTVTSRLFNRTCRITRHNVSVTRYKSVIKKKKTAMTDRQPVQKVASTSLIMKKMFLEETK